MTDDALIEKMCDAGFGKADLPDVVKLMMRECMRRALAVASKAILVNAATLAEDRVVHEHSEYGTTICAKTADQIAAELRALADTGQHNEQ